MTNILLEGLVMIEDSNGFTLTDCRICSWILSLLIVSLTSLESPDLHSFQTAAAASWFWCPARWKPKPITGILLPDPTCSIGAFGSQSHRFKTCQVWPRRPVEILLRPTSSDLWHVVHNSAGFVRTHGEFSPCQLRVYSPLCCFILGYHFCIF